MGGEVKEEKNKKAYKPPKYKLEELLKAVKNCNMAIIKEFIDEIYSRRNEKVHHCVEMWKVSQKENQKEVEKKLAQHYHDLIEDTSEHKLTGSAESQVRTFTDLETALLERKWSQGQNKNVNED